MNRKFLLIIAAAVVVFVAAIGALIAFTPDPPPPHAIAQQHITVLLDLSNRIDPNLNRGPQTARDLQDVQTVLKVFKDQIKRNLYINSRDRLSVVVSRQRGSSTAAVAENQADFSFDMATQPISGKRPKDVEANTDKLYQQTAQLYAQTKAQAAQKGYTGADIWSFFESELSVHMLSSKAAPLDSIIQTVVIVTDGYNDFSQDILKKRPFSGNRTSFGQVRRLAAKPDPLGTFDRDNYGLLATQKYPDLRVVVLELAPDGNDATQEQLIRRYWTKWFAEMAIPPDHYQLLLNNAPPSVTEAALLHVIQAPASKAPPVASTN